MATCPVCSGDSTGGLCGPCAACGPAFFAASPGERLAQLSAATVRQDVLTAAIRGGKLWEDEVGPAGEDLGRSILEWLRTHGATLVWVRYLAEDSRWGWLAQPQCAASEFPRALLRAPEWFMRPEGAVPPIDAWGRSGPADLAALGFRFGSCGVPAERWQRAIPFGGGWVASLAASRGTAHPTQDSWRPDAAQLARKPRRWPIPRWEEGCAVVCSLCAEALPAHGPCSWCGTDPAKEPPTLAPVRELLLERRLCPTCGLDQGTRFAPVRCAGCGGPPA